MIYNFDQVINRRGTYSVKYDGLPDNMSDVIPLTTADMDFPTAQPVIDAMHRVADFNMYGYSSELCAPELMPAICGWWKRRFNAAITEEQIAVSVGILSAIDVAIQTFTAPGDGIIIQRPVFGFFTSRIEHFQRVVADNHLLCDDSGRYTMDFEDLERKCKDPFNRAMILCNPANPVGRAWTREELEKVCEITRRNHVLLICDEAHCDMIRRGYTHTTILNAAKEPDNIILLSGVNKTFNVAGLMPSFAVIPDPSLRARFVRTRGYANPSAFSIAAMIAGYTQGEEWLDQVNAYIDDTMDFTVEYFKENLPWVKFRRPEGTYCLWLNFEACRLSPDELDRRLLETARVKTSPGKSFDPASTMYRRICVPTPRSVLKTAYDRIADAFSNLPIV